jgi:hypothetical protein
MSLMSRSVFVSVLLLMFRLLCTGESYVKTGCRKRVRRSKIISIKRLAYLHGKGGGAVDNEDGGNSESPNGTYIYCATEEGDTALIHWNTTTVNKEDQIVTNKTNKNMNKPQEQHRPTDKVLPNVQWSIHDHFGRTISFEQSPFSPPILLSVRCWGFHIWNVQDPSEKKPLFISPHLSTVFTVGRWSPSRPGLILQC